MKKVLSYALIVLVFAQLFAPFSVGFDKKELTVKNNVAEASTQKVEASSGLFGNDLGIRADITASVTSSSVSITVSPTWTTNTIFSQEMVLVGIKGPEGEGKIEKASLSPSGELKQSGTVLFGDLKPATTYYVFVRAVQTSTSLVGELLNITQTFPNLIGGWLGADDWPVVGVLFQDNQSDGEISNINNPYQITTLAQGSTETQKLDLGTLRNAASFLPVCDIMESSTWPGCIGVFLYSFVFKPSSFLFAKTGELLDFTVGYSVRDQSYRSSFVVEGWGVVRDFCNMFFIFILLYIAFRAILNLHGAKTKEAIINVVIIGLLINFSLFVTQVIIDTSNILTRVFYNSQTIKVGPMVNGEIKEELGDSGEIKLSEALVSKINPQDLIINASKVEMVSTGDGMSDEKVEANGITAGTFILVVILASVVNIVGIVVFLTCALLFVTRVVGLWMAMIFAPIAFFSYAAPGMKDIDTIGWKKWWPETLKLAFMAPVFVFFIYLIIKFLETGLGLADASNSWNINKIDFILKTFIPFIFIMVLLLRAKKVAVKMSGEMGEAVSKIGAAVAGIGLAAATGGAAMAMRGSLGRAGSAIANSEKLKNAEAKGGIGGWGAKQLRSIGGVAGKGSFDLRGTKAGASVSKGLGVDMSGKGSGLAFAKVKEGGFEKRKSEQIEKRQKKAKELELGESSKEVLSLRKTEVDIAKLKEASKSILDGLNNNIETAERELQNTTRTFGAGDTRTQEAGLKLRNLQAKKKALMEGNLYAGDRDINGQMTNNNREDFRRFNAGEARDNNGNVIYRTNANGNQEVVTRSLNYLQKEELRDKQNIIRKVNNERRENYAKSIQDKLSQRINFVVSGGQHSFKAEKIAGGRILAGIQEEK